jgi:CRISPR-associated protein Csd2
MNNRYDFIYIFDVKDANPNGDPDAGNLPRVDAETGHGLITDVCLKRKVRNFVALTKEGQPNHDIYVKEKAILNHQHARAYTALKLDPKKAKQPEVDQTRAWMCQNFYDIRTFGAVMTTETNCGQVRGPAQLAFSRSVDPIVSSEHAVTRCAVTTEREAEKQDGDNRTMGRKFTVPYALYRCHGAINPFLAQQTGFSDADLELFFTALEKAFDFDASAARPAGSMAARKLIVFKHATALGNAPAHKLFEAVTIQHKDDSKPPRAFTDYEILPHDLKMTIEAQFSGIEVIERI